MSSKALRIAAAGIIGFAVGLLIAVAEWLFVHIPAGAYYTYGLMLVWPARVLIPNAPISAIAMSMAIAANALLYAAAAALADRIYTRINQRSNSLRMIP